MLLIKNFTNIRLIEVTRNIPRNHATNSPILGSSSFPPPLYHYLPSNHLSQLLDSSHLNLSESPCALSINVTRLWYRQLSCTAQDVHKSPAKSAAAETLSGSHKHFTWYKPVPGDEGFYISSWNVAAVFPRSADIEPRKSVLYAWVLELSAMGGVAAFLPR